jgi:hypothetical protein
MNKVELMFLHSQWLKNIVPHYAPLALRLNEWVENKDFVEFKRTGPCGVFINKDDTTIGYHHIPDNVDDPKFRYSTNANNKVIFLLENPIRKSTKAKDEEERKLLEGKSIWRGGILLPDGTRIGTSGFHPLVDEAMDIHIGLLVTTVKTDREEKTKWVKDRAIEFQNPYALCLSSMVSQHSLNLTPEKALEWGLKNIPKQEF